MQADGAHTRGVRVPYAATRRHQFLVMASWSAATLTAGIGRELLLARTLRMSDEADAFFRGWVVLSTIRALTLTVLRVRWLAHDRPPENPWSDTSRGLLLAAVVGWLGMAIALGQASATWLGASWALGVAIAVGSSVPRVLAEASGREGVAFATDVLTPLGTITGVLCWGPSAQSALSGALLGLSVGGALAAVAARSPSHGAEVPRTPQHSKSTHVVVDTLLYANVGWWDALLSARIYAPGAFAQLNYGFMFVNAVLVVPSAALQVLALRDIERSASSRRWTALGAGISAAAATALVAGFLGSSWCPVSLDRWMGWPMGQSSEGIVWAAVPFAGLKLANTVGRAHRLVKAPRSLWLADGVGWLLRTGLLLALAPLWGALASAWALAAAESVQLVAWWNDPAAR